MKITRKTFLKSTTVLAGGMFLQGNKLVRTLLQEDKRFTELRNGYGIFTERGGTIGWYISDDALVAIDTQFRDTVPHFIKAIRQRTSRKFDVVFNTHHHGDHTSGNKILRPIAEHIVAQENCPRLQKEKYSEKEPVENLVYADITFTANFELDLGKEHINAFHLYPAHTGGDTVIHFQNSNIVHVGDLVFNRIYPWFGSTDGGGLKGWIKYLEGIHERFDDDTLFIFGHGTEVTGKRSDLLYMRDYLSSLVEFVEKEIAAGKSIEEVAAAKSIPGANERSATWDGAMKANLEEAYKNLLK